VHIYLFVRDKLLVLVSGQDPLDGLNSADDGRVVVDNKWVYLILKMGKEPLQALILARWITLFHIDESTLNEPYLLLSCDEVQSLNVNVRLEEIKD
jgi:hypothetical protein